MIDEALSIVLVFQSILGFLQILDVLRLPFFPTVDRLTRPEIFELDQSLVLPLLFFLGISVTFALWKKRRILGLLPSMSLILYPYYGVEATIAVASLTSVIITLYISREFKQYIRWTFLVISVANILSLLHWMLFMPLNVHSFLESLGFLELDIFYIASYLAPLIILPMLFTWVIKYMLTWAWDSEIVGGMPQYQPIERNLVNILLVSAILLSIISAFYPYLTNVNPEGLNVGVDIRRYVDWVKIVDKDISQAFNVSGGSRPLIPLLLVSFKRLSGLSYTSSVRYLPVILNPLLVYSVFFLAYEAYQDPWLASWASFFTACGYQITVNMYSYFLTNILGLSLIFLSLGFLFRTMRKGDNNSLFFASLLGSLLVFTHPWTFDQYFAAIFLSAALSYYYRKEGKEQTFLKPMVLYLAILTIAELVKTQFFKGVGGVVAASKALNGIAGLSGFWFSSIFNFRLLYGGFMSNILLLGLAAIGIFLTGYKEMHERILSFLVLLTSMVFLIGDGTIKSRLLFNIPIGLFAALGFLWVYKQINDRDIRYGFISFSISSMIIYLFQSLANL